MTLDPRPSDRELLARLGRNTPVAIKAVQWREGKRHVVSLDPQMPAKWHQADGMNKTERDYADMLEMVRRASGGILRWQFGCISLQLAPRTWYRPDFLVVTSRNEIEMHEVKGFWRDDARVKIKVAAAAFPEFRFLAASKRRKRDGGGWTIEHFPTRS